MPRRLPITAGLFAIFLAACGDAGVTGPSFQHLTSVALGSGFSCGLDGDGRAFCWGPNNSLGQLGTGDNKASTIPVAVKTAARFSQIVVGREHSCALATDGRAFCWGGNTQSQLGIETSELSCELLQSNGWLQDFGDACSTTPVPVQTPLRFKRLDSGADATCGLTGAGELWCWGSGVLGDSDGVAKSDSLVRVAASVKFKAFAMYELRTCAVDQGGLGWCWGYDYDGALGLGTVLGQPSYAPTPLRINSVSSLTGVAMGDTHVCALTAVGEILCWGEGGFGQRGDSTTLGVQRDPTLVKTDRKFTSITAAGMSTCAVEAGTGAAWCWGANPTGGLGVGTTTDRLAPARVLGSLHFRELFMTADGYPWPSTTCGASSGAIYCWGLLPEPLTFEE